MCGNCSHHHQRSREQHAQGSRITVTAARMLGVVTEEQDGRCYVRRASGRYLRMQGKVCVSSGPEYYLDRHQRETRQPAPHDVVGRFSDTSTSLNPSQPMYAMQYDRMTAIFELLELM